MGGGRWARTRTAAITEAYRSPPKASRFAGPLSAGSPAAQARTAAEQGAGEDLSPSVHFHSCSGTSAKVGCAAASPKQHDRQAHVHRPTQSVRPFLLALPYPRRSQPWSILTCSVRMLSNKHAKLACCGIAAGGMTLHGAVCSTAAQCWKCCGAQTWTQGNLVPLAILMSPSPSTACCATTVYSSHGSSNNAAEKAVGMPCLICCERV